MYTCTAQFTIELLYMLHTLRTVQKEAVEMGYWDEGQIQYTWQLGQQSLQQCSESLLMLAVKKGTLTSLAVHTMVGNVIGQMYHVTHD